MGKGFFDNPFDGLFDFNGDGKEDIFEQIMGIEILEDLEDDSDDDLFDSDDDFDADNGQDFDLF